MQKNRLSFVLRLSCSVVVFDGGGDNGGVVCVRIWPLLLSLFGHIAALRS